MNPTSVTPILEALQTIVRVAGSVVEVRIPKTTKGTVSGYFDDLEALDQAVRPWDGQASIYTTLNPVQPDCLARAANRLKAYTGGGERTKDSEILRRIWLPIDGDPKRPPGISATQAELAAALERRDAVVRFLAELGWPEPFTGMSGNGGHAGYPINEPNDAETRQLLERCLKALAARFSDGRVEIDTGVFNAARIWKLYGTIAVKGDATPDRPHRRAVLDPVPFMLEEVTRAQLEQLAAMAPAPTPRAGGRMNQDAGHDFPELIEALRGQGLYLRHAGARHFVTCPWKAEHSMESGPSETALYEPAADNDFAGGFKCQHLHCGARTIKDLYARLLPRRESGRRATNGPSAAPAEPTPSDARLLTVAEAQARIGAESEWLVDGMLAVGDMSLWVAKPGVGKSALLRQLARAVSSGAPFLGHDVKQGQVVYLALEGARATLAHLIRLGHEPASDRILVYIDEVEGGSTPAEWLREKLAAITPALIIVDCLGDFARIDERSNNAGYGAIYRALGPVLQYAQNQRTHIALIHHAGKRVDQAGIDAALGSTGITGKPGTVFSYRLSDPGDRQSPRILSCSKHRAGDSADLPDVVLGWDPDSQTVSISGLADRLGLMAAGIALIQEVLRQPGITNQALIAEVSGRRAAKVSALQALRDEGILTRSGKGGTRHDPFTWAINPTVNDPISAWRAYGARIENTAVQGGPVSRSRDVQTGANTENTGNGLLAGQLPDLAVPEPGNGYPFHPFPGPVPTGGTANSPVEHSQLPVPAVPTPIEQGKGTGNEIDPDGMFERWRARAAQDSVPAVPDPPAPEKKLPW